MKEIYGIFISIMSRSEIEKTIYLRLANSKKDNKDKQEEKLFWV